MKWSSRFSGILLTSVLLLGINLPIGAAVNESGRQSEQDVNSPDLRQKQGLIPGTALLFNGWGMTPAGESVPIADLALKLTITPDSRVLIAVHGGFNKHGVTVFDLASKKQTEFVPLAESWNGLAFGIDHKRFFLSGGDSGQIHIFSYDAGRTKLERSASPSATSSNVFLAGIAVHPGTGKLYVCNEADHRDLGGRSCVDCTLEKTIPVGLHPHSCLFGADNRHFM